MVVFFCGGWLSPLEYPVNVGIRADPRLSAAISALRHLCKQTYEDECSRVPGPGGSGTHVLYNI
jgi:hypothetical protein